MTGEHFTILAAEAQVFAAVVDARGWMRLAT
jgi:hypothetical protein